MPDRLIIEPTGLATIGQVMAILTQDEIQRLYDSIRLIHIVDGTEFLAFIKANRRFVENQIRASQVVLLNKIDLLTSSRASLLAASIRDIHPAASVYPTSFARLAPDVMTELFARERTAADPLSLTGMEGPGETKYESFGRRYSTEVFQPERLYAFFQQLQTQQYGDAIRAKGIFRTERAWLAIELAAGTVQRTPGPAGPESLISIIGQGLDSAVLDAQLQQCVLKRETANESASEM
jgi:G3E family GTPase